MVYKEFTKDPDAKLDYKIDWTDWLEPYSDTISTSTWTVPSGLTKISDTNTSYTTTIWLSSGLEDGVYEVVNHIVTAAGREDDRTLLIRVDPK